MKLYSGEMLPIRYSSNGRLACQSWTCEWPVNLIG